MNTTVHLAPTPEDEVDEFLLELTAEFGKKEPKAKRSRAAAEATYFPPAPNWKPVALTLMVVEQICDCCGESHKHSTGIFVESICPSITARRFTRYTPSDDLTIELLPRSRDIQVEHVTECYTCFGIEEQLMRLHPEGCTQLNLSLED